MTPKKFLLSVGGSLVVPDEIDTGFIGRFYETIVERIGDGCSFVLVVGGGKTARRYINGAGQIHHIEDEDKDWLGIHATRMNAHFLRTVFREFAFPKINTNPHDLEDFLHVKEPILVAGGWRPGFSTDYIAVLLAEYLGFSSLLNLSNVDGVYDRNPKEYTDATRFESLSWKEYRALIGDVWRPGMNVPFDPIASKLAEEKGFSVTVMDGAGTENLRRVLLGERGIGTVLH